MTNFVNSLGIIDDFGLSVADNGIAVRPALYINL